jgi:hypothetical protein
LRHTFATHLSKSGVAPRVAQAAMRHSTLDLTMNVYTDPKLLDVGGALDALPSLPLGRRAAEGDALQATGTEGDFRRGACSLAPTLAPTPDIPGTTLSFSGNPASSDVPNSLAVSGNADKRKGPPSSPDGGPSRAGDRIRTGDVQLGKTATSPAEKNRKPLRLSILGISRLICKRVRALSSACENTRKFRRSGALCGRLPQKEGGTRKADCRHQDPSGGLPGRRVGGQGRAGVSGAACVRPGGRARAFAPAVSRPEKRARRRLRPAPLPPQLDPSPQQNLPGPPRRSGGFPGPRGGRPGRLRTAPPAWPPARRRPRSPCGGRCSGAAGGPSTCRCPGGAAPRWRGTCTRRAAGLTRRRTAYPPGSGTAGRPGSSPLWRAWRCSTLPAFNDDRHPGADFTPKLLARPAARGLVWAVQQLEAFGAKDRRSRASVRAGRNLPALTLTDTPRVAQPSHPGQDVRSRRC